LLRRSEGRIHKRLRTIVADPKLRSGCKRPAVSHPGSSRGIRPGDDNGPNTPVLHEIWAASRLLGKYQPVALCVLPRASGSASRSQPAESKDLFLKAGHDQKAIGARRADRRSAYSAAFRINEAAAGGLASDRPAVTVSTRFRCALKIRNGSRARARC
jgi:hypothetical protein